MVEGKFVNVHDCMTANKKKDQLV